MLNQQEAKARARILKTFLAEQGVTLSHGLMLEAVARLEHHKNWATFVAASNAEAALVKSPAEVAGWQLRVFYLDEEDTLHVLPEGACFSDAGRYDNWRLFRDNDAFPVPEGFVLGPQVAVQAVLAELPDVEQYGLPDNANDAIAAQWMRTHYGVAVTTDLDVTVHDRGDDGDSRIWFEARVEPAAAAKLPKQAVPTTSGESLEEQAWRRVFDRVFARKADLEMPKVRDAVARAFARAPTADPAGQQVCRLVLDALERASRTVHTRGVSGEAFLRTAFGSEVELAKSFNRLSCARLYGTMKVLAKAEWEQASLAHRA